jgi:acetyl esterase/lipase
MLEVEVRKDVEYASHDGVSLRGNLYSPKGPGPFPAIVAVHGGGWKGLSRDTYQYLGPWLAQRGYILYAVTYRLSQPGKNTFPEAVQDVRAAVQFIKGNAASLKVDAERVALMGDSAGGHLSALVALAGEHPLFKEGNAGDPHGGVSTSVKAAIPIYGIYDMPAQWRHDQLVRFDDHIVPMFLGADLSEDRRVYFDASPLSYVSNRNNATSFLVVWGTGDDVVDWQTQSEPFVEALKQARQFTRTVIVPAAPHFWVSDPMDEPGSYPAFFAPRLLRFLEARL